MFVVVFPNSPGLDDAERERYACFLTADGLFLASGGALLGKLMKLVSANIDCRYHRPILAVKPSVARSGLE